MQTSFKTLYNDRSIQVVIVCLILTASLLWHAEGRQTHYQELDSTQTYDMIHNYPVPTDLYVNGWGKSANKYVAEKNRILFEKLKQAKLPYAFEFAWVMPLSSTYCFGMGFIIGLITYPDISYADFASRVLLMNIFLFHLTAFLLYISLRRLSTGFFAAFISTLLFLFSISYYSYGIHMGSTIWNVFTSFIWVASFVFARNDRSRDRVINYVTGILFLFNYLIVLYWLGYLLNTVIRDREKSAKLILIRKVFSDNWFSFILITAFTILFYQPGQGLRGSIDSYQKIFTTPYYIILNFFSFFNHNKLIDFIQFIVFSIILIGGILFTIKSYKNRVPENNSVKSEFEIYGFLFMIVFFLFVFFKLLGVAPSRHILFIAPLVFFWVAIFFQRIQTSIQKLWIRNGFAVLVLLAGVFSLIQRKEDTHNRIFSLRTSIPVQPDSLLLNNDFSNFKQILYPLHIANRYCKNYSQLSTGIKYLYFSQEVPFDKYLSSIGKSFADINKYYEYSYASNINFIAYDPYHYVYNRANNIYYCIFSLQQSGK